MAVITLSAGIGFAFALHEGPREQAWSAHHVVASGAPQTATR
jgi:hypothetical protein